MIHNLWHTAGHTGRTVFCAKTSPDLAPTKMKCLSQEPDPTCSHGKKMTEQTFKKSRHPDRIPVWKNLCSMLRSFDFFWPPQHRPKSPRVVWVCAISLNKQIGKIMPAKQSTDQETCCIFQEQAAFRSKIVQPRCQHAFWQQWQNLSVVSRYTGLKAREMK